LKPSTRSCYSFDSGVLIEMLLGTPAGRMMSDSLLLDPPITANTCHFNLSEAEYVLCRLLDRTQARSKVDNLVRSNYINLTDAAKLYANAAEIKCERALALGDCYTIANAKVTGSIALFAFQEEELKNEMERKPFDVELLFIEGPPRTVSPS
jgi:predicted nucleic acid-binding protein